MRSIILFVCVKWLTNSGISKALKTWSSNRDDNTGAENLAIIKHYIFMNKFNHFN